jgi:hypothetical protein
MSWNGRKNAGNEGSVPFAAAAEESEGAVNSSMDPGDERRFRICRVVDIG